MMLNYLKKIRYEIFIGLLFLGATNISSIQAQTLSSLQHLTENLVLMCEETYRFDYRTLDKEYGEDRKLLGRLMDERNNDSERPFFVLKYIEKKLSFNSEGVNFLINETPNESNEIGWIGSIHTTNNKIMFDLFNVKDRRYITIISIDRFTGLFEESRYLPEKNLPDTKANGKCSKRNTRLF